MPHLNLQISDNINLDNANDLLSALNATLWNSAEFIKPEELKSRILTVENSLVGLEEDKDKHGFIYVQCKIMAGRSDTVKNKFAEDIIKTIQALIPKNESIAIQLCVEVEEISPIYHKTIIQ